MVKRIDKDIANLFDENSSDYLNAAMISKSSAFIDTEKNEYHWLCATGSSTAINREFVYDIRQVKWFEMDRTSTKVLQCGFEVMDTNNAKYTYGGTAAGYVYRFEYGHDV